MTYLDCACEPARKIGIFIQNAKRPVSLEELRNEFPKGTILEDNHKNLGISNDDTLEFWIQELLCAEFITICIKDNQFFLKRSTVE